MMIEDVTTIEEDFPICPLCKKMIMSDAGLENTVRHCGLCGMPTENMDRFCCSKCEGKYKKFIEKRLENARNN